MTMITGEDNIKAFAYLQVYHKLKLEVNHPNGPKWRESPMNQAKKIMENNGYICTNRTKKKVLEHYTRFLTDKGILT